MLPLALLAYEFCSCEHLDMLGYRCKRHRISFCDLTDGQTALGDPAKNVASSRIAQTGKDRSKVFYTFNHMV